MKKSISFGLWLVTGAIASTVGTPLLSLPAIANTSNILVASETATEEQATSAEDSKEKKDSKSEEESSLKAFEEITKDKEVLEGIFTLYRDRETGKTYLEIQPEQLNQNFLYAATLASGLGDWGLYSGWPLQDTIFQFRRHRKQIQIVVPNHYFRTNPGDPQRRSVERSFSDSIIQTLPIKSIHPERDSILVEVSSGLLASLSGFGSRLGFMSGGESSSPASAGPNSYLDTAKAFPLNLELESVYHLSGVSSPFFSFDALPDSRGFSLRVHSSFSRLPENGYKPRLADNRVGYFISAHQNLSEEGEDPFVRYIQRWHLEKQNPNAAISPPKEPIVFWIENTVPQEYRDAIRQGILMWNEAFEKAGFRNAIQVKQMPDDADWDPADVRYNTIRWSNSFYPMAYGIGPSRVNPITGQILDADVILDAGAIRSLKNYYSSFLDRSGTDGDASGLNGEGFSSLLCSFRQMSVSDRQIEALQNRLPENISPQQKQFLQMFANRRQHQHGGKSCFHRSIAQEAAFGALSLNYLRGVMPSSEEMKTFVHQFLRSLVAHEVGHTLGLRHNFHGSTMLSPEELNNQEITRDRGMVGSIMDYFPPNIAPEKEQQGDYFPVVVGPYDEWAIEYGYKSIDAMTPQGEQDELEKIADRANNDEFAYASDHDVFDPVYPHMNRWDLSSDPLAYARTQMKNVQKIWKRWQKSGSGGSGDNYSKLRDRFQTSLRQYFRQAYTLTRYIGGQTFHRYHPDNQQQLPFATIPAAKQEQALDSLLETVFAAENFQFSPELLNKLAPSRWSHWGSRPNMRRLDYPLYDQVLFYQSLILGDLLSAERLERMRDVEMKSGDKDVLTMAELFASLQADIWSELEDKESDTLEISTLRQGLQRQYLQMLTNLVSQDVDELWDSTTIQDFMASLFTLGAPKQAGVLARYHLQELQENIDRSLRKRDDEMNLTTKAHLQDTRDRIEEVLNPGSRSR